MKSLSKKIFASLAVTSLALNAVPALAESLPLPTPSLRVADTTYRSVKLTWTYTSTTEDGSILEVDAGGSDGFVPVARLLKSARSYEHIDGLEPEAIYKYRIRTYRGEDEFSAYSNTVNATTKSIPVRIFGEMSDAITEHFKQTLEQAFPGPDFLRDYIDNVNKKWDFTRLPSKQWLNTNSTIPATANRHIELKEASVADPSRNTNCFNDYNYSATCPQGSNNNCNVSGVSTKVGQQCGENETGNWVLPFPFNTEAEEPSGKDFEPTRAGPDPLETFLAPWSVRNTCGQEINSAVCQSGNELLKTRTAAKDCSYEELENMTYTHQEVVSLNAKRIESCPGSYPVCLQGPDKAVGEIFPGAACERCTRVEDGYDPLKTDPPKVAYIDIASVKFEFDPQYIKDTELNRLYTPSKPFSPFDDFYVEVKMKLCPYAGKPAPQYLGFKSRVAVDTPTGPVTVIHGTPQSFVKVKETATEAYYRWTFKGWSNNQQGVARDADQNPSDNLMNVLVSSISDTTADRNPWVIIDDGRGGVGRYKMTDAEKISPCVHVWGRDALQHKAVDMRGKTTKLSPIELVAQTIANIFEFSAVNPFKSHLDEFAFYTDLTEVDDTLWITSDGIATPQMQLPEKLSRCNERIGKGRLYYFHFDALLMRPGTIYKKSYSKLGGNSLLINSYRSFAENSRVAMHETGHALGALDDEYFPANFLGTTFVKNCVFDANKQYRYPITTNNSATLYGEINKIGCTLTNAYRPSETSIMKDHLESNAFNVISCGYIMHAIKGTSGVKADKTTPVPGWKKTPQEYWPECAQMPGVIKPP